jgi:flagellar basal body-associated protein FliL
MPTVGPVLALDEFTVNLKDADRERYLRASISLTVTANDPKFGKLAGEEAKKWEEEFHIEMGPYVPAVRDLIISALTKRTAAELSTAVGKEEVKDEVKKGVDALFHGDRKVIRVNLENFIIQ